MGRVIRGIAAIGVAGALATGIGACASDDGGDEGGSSPASVAGGTPSGSSSTPSPGASTSATTSATTSGATATSTSPSAPAEAPVNRGGATVCRDYIRMPEGDQRAVLSGFVTERGNANSDARAVDFLQVLLSGACLGEDVADHTVAQVLGPIPGGGR